jgi:heterodisulfide reductase subunit C
LNHQRRVERATGSTSWQKEGDELAVIVNPNLLGEMKKLGAFDISACFNCGNCTAVCPLSTEEEAFPRKMIRYAAVGLQDKLLSSAELWSCDYCGECTKTCPRSADPGGFMMAARRYAIKKYSWGRISDAMYSSRIVFYGSLAVLSLFLTAIILMFHGPIALSRVEMFSFIPMGAVDWAGMAVGVFVGVSALANLIIMNSYLSSNAKQLSSAADAKRSSSKAAALVRVLVDEVAIQKRLRSCTDGNRYWAHLLLVWGFVGLLVATTLDYTIDVYSVPLPYYVPRGLGVVSGLALVYGSAYFIYKRLEGKEEYATFTDFMDWTFLLLLVLVGVTGFLLDLFLLADLALGAYVTYALHLILVFDLLVTAPFTKFAHALYRPLALWLEESGHAAKKHELSPKLVQTAT